MEIFKKKTMSPRQIERKIDEHKTSHVLHLLLSLISAGLWIPLWIIISFSNNMERNRLERLLK